MSVVADFFETTPRNWRARLAVTTDIMRDLSRYTDPEGLYRALVRRMSQIYPTDRHVSLSRHGLSYPDVRITRYNRWTGDDADVNPFIDHHKLPIVSGGLFAELLYGAEARVLDELDVAPDDPAAGYLDGQGSALAIPLFEGGSVVHAVVMSRDEPHAFPRASVPEMVWMCNMFSRAMQTLAQSDRLRRQNDTSAYELRAVADIQHGLLPASVPKVPGLDVAVHYRTVNQAGGDYYDFFPLPDGKLGVLVADVSGHGSPAAVIMAITHSLAHAAPEPPVSPGRMLAHLNAHLGRRYTRATGSFVTGFYAVFDPAHGTLTYAAAGHPSPRISRAGEAKWWPLPCPNRLPLGVNPRDSAYPEQSVRFEPGDRVALFTDGMLDAVNKAGDPYSYESLSAALAGSPPDAAGVVGAVVNDLDHFADGMPPADDRTLLVVRRDA